MESDILVEPNKIHQDIDNHFSIPETIRKQYKNYILNNLKPPNSFRSDCEDCPHHRLPADDRNIVEVDCIGLLGKNYCLNSGNLTLVENDKIIIDSSGSLKLATVKITGKLVKIRRHLMGLANEDLPYIIRKATGEDIKKEEINSIDAKKAKPVFEKLVAEENLNMKLVDAHYQFDRKKLFFFYTSDGRVDFRSLAKKLAGVFKTRIELRQMGVRDEAKLLGGVGTCGREFCCTSFLHGFKRITTDIANEQNVSANLSKLSGPCGKLKCCLAFEID